MKQKSSQKEKTQKTLVLLDTHAIIHRAFHAVPDFQSSLGVPTGALYGLLNMFLKMLSDLKPDYVIACYDLPEPTFRHESYDGYKKGRKSTDDSLKAQIEESRNIFYTLGIPMYQEAGFEADDMLGTITEQILAQFDHINIVIVSGDMDTLQLVTTDRVSVYTMKKGIHETMVYKEQDVYNRFSFGPELIPDFKGLRGDPSDNIIGVPGIGEKTATELITKIGTIEDIYTKLHQDQENLIKLGIKKRTIELLLQNEDSAQFSKILATIRRDAPIEFLLPDQEFSKQYDKEKMIRLLREYEFRSLVGKFENLFGDSSQKKQDKKNISTEISETSDIHVNKISQGESNNWKITYEASVGLWVLNSDMTHPSPSEIMQETETDTIEQAHAVIIDKLKKENLIQVFEKIELPLIGIVQKMTERGVMLDNNFLQELSKKYHQKLKDLSIEIFKYAKKEFNLNSPKQLSEFLFEEIGLKPKGKKNKTGSYSTKAEILDDLVSEHDVVQKIIDHRDLQKLLSTYIDILPTLVDDQNRLHAQFLQHGTTTGRFSSQNPNLQNIPVRSELGRVIRNSFVAADEYVLVSADYSQIELRVLAMLSGDPILYDVFKNNKDIHTTVASRVFNVPENEVSGNQRRDAKVINFGIIYGMGISSLQKNLGGTRAEAEQFYQAYFEEFPSIREYLDHIKKIAKETLQTKTIFGRIRNFPMFRSKLPFMIALAERTATNAPIQGTAADIIKLAMVDIDRILQEKGWNQDIFPILQIHDEIVYEVSEKKVDEFIQVLKNSMESVIINYESMFDSSTVKNIDIPITVSVKKGKNLGEMENVE